MKEKLEIKIQFGQTLYWDYYSYVKNNRIIDWNKNTYILYGNSDDTQDFNTIKDFSDKFKCRLLVLVDGEHYFHTKEQLEYYEKWLSKNI